jgi:hypothetical protein
VSNGFQELDRIDICPVLTHDYTDITHVRAVDNYDGLVQLGLRWQQESNVDVFCNGVPSLICRLQRNLALEEALCDKPRLGGPRGPAGPATVIIFYAESDHDRLSIEYFLDASFQQPFAGPVCDGSGMPQH